jgi:hypothetical protein
MDFIGGLPKVKGKDTILVVVDRLSKGAHFMALSHPYTTRTVAAIFVNEIVKLHGFPASIISDRDRVFMSLFWKLFSLAGTKLKFSSAYHPQTDGQSEVTNRTLETYLRCFVNGKPKQWVKWLGWAEFWFNSSFNSSIGMSPFKAVYGREAPTIIKYPRAGARVQGVDQLLVERDEVLGELKDQLCKAQNSMKQWADKKRRDVVFDVGDMVYVKAQPYRFKSLANRPNEKLGPRFYGPFSVVERIGQVAYKLNLPTNAKIHLVFHVSQLKKAVGAGHMVQPLPQCLNEEWELQVQPKEVLAVQKLLNGTEQVLIRWEGLPEAEDTWEEVAVMIHVFPDFNLEDKVKLVGGSIDRPVKHVYKRRGKRGMVNEGAHMQGGQLAVNGREECVQNDIITEGTGGTKGLEDND